MSFDPPRPFLWKYVLTSKTILRRYLDPMGHRQNDGKYQLPPQVRFYLYKPWAEGRYLDHACMKYEYTWTLLSGCPGWTTPHYL